MTCILARVTLVVLALSIELCSSMTVRHAGHPRQAGKGVRPLQYVSPAGVGRPVKYYPEIDQQFEQSQPHHDCRDIDRWDNVVGVSENTPLGVNHLEPRRGRLLNGDRGFDQLAEEESRLVPYMLNVDNLDTNEYNLVNDHSLAEESKFKNHQLLNNEEETVENDIVRRQAMIEEGDPGESRFHRPADPTFTFHLLSEYGHDHPGKPLKLQRRAHCFDDSAVDSSSGSNSDSAYKKSASDSAFAGKFKSAAASDDSDSMDDFDTKSDSSSKDATDDDDIDGTTMMGGRSHGYSWGSKARGGPGSSKCRGGGGGSTARNRGGSAAHRGKGGGKECVNAGCCDSTGANSPACQQKTTQLAQEAAGEATAAMDAQQAAGLRAAYQVKSQLAEKACQAYNSAQAALDGKQAMLDMLTTQLNEAQTLLDNEKNELSSIDRNELSIKQTAKATHKMAENVAKTAQQASNIAERLTKIDNRAKTILTDEGTLVGGTNAKIERLSNMVNEAQRDVEATCAAAKQAAHAAQMSRQNAMKCRKRRLAGAAAMGRERASGTRKRRMAAGRGTTSIRRTRTLPLCSCLGRRTRRPY